MAEVGNPNGGVRERLKTRTERIPLRALERRGFKSVKVVDMATIERIVGDAVESVLEKRQTTLAAGERADLERDAKKEFLTLLEAHKQLKQQKVASDKRREDLETQMQMLREERKRQQAELKAEREREITDGFKISPASFLDMEQKIRKLFKNLMTDEQRRSLAEIGPRALRGLTEFEQELAAMIDHLLEDERARYLERERVEHEGKIDFLERRILKLNKALSDSEGALLKLAKMKSIDPGVASIYDCVQGLSLVDPSYQRKSELLKEIFVQNLEIQGKDVLAEDLDDDETRVAPVAPGELKVPDDFLTPAPVDFVDSLIDGVAF